MRRIVLVTFDAVSDRMMEDLTVLLERSEHRIVCLRFSHPYEPISVSQPEEVWGSGEPDDGSVRSRDDDPSHDRPSQNLRPISPVLLRVDEAQAITRLLEDIYEGDLVLTFMDSESRDLVIPASYFSGASIRKGAFSIGVLIRRGPIRSRDRLEEINKVFLDLGLHFHGVAGLSPAVHRERRFLELAHLVRHLGTLVFKPGLVNLDLADLLITSKGGTALVMTWGMAQPGGRPSRTSIKDAIRNPLCDIDLSSVRKALVHVVSDSDLTLEDSLISTEYLRSKIRDNARIIWGVTLTHDPDEEMEVLLVLATTPIELLMHWYSRDGGSVPQGAGPGA